MNNKNTDQEPITAEKIQSAYPDIQLTINDTSKPAGNPPNDCSPKTGPIPPKVPVSTATLTKTTIKKTLSSPTERKVPPYVNALPPDPVRAFKNPQPKLQFVKSYTKVTDNVAVTVTAESTVASLPSTPVKTLASGDVKKFVNTQPIRPAVPQTTIKPADKAVVSSTTSADESKPIIGNESEPKNAEKASPVLSTRPTQVQCRATNVLEKNIQSNVLTVTSRPSLSKVIPSNTKTAETNTIVSISKSTSNSPSTPKHTLTKSPILYTESLCKQKSVSIQSIDSPKIINRFVIPNNSLKSDSTTNTKPAAADASIKNTHKVVVVTSADTSVRTKSPSTSVVSSPKIQNFESFNVPPAPSIKTTKPNLASGNLQILSLSDIQKNEDILKAINSGSTASVGQNVTISSGSLTSAPPVETTRSTPDLKIRNVSSETTIETIAKQTNPNLPAQKNRNGNSAEVGQSSKQDSTPNSRASSPGEITSKRNEIPGLAEIQCANPVETMTTLKKKSEEPVECLTISSDEETESEQYVSPVHNDVSVSILNKEPPIERDDDISNKSSNGREQLEKEVDTILEATTGDGFLNLICRTVRIGSYKIRPRNGVTISQYGLKIVVPTLNNSNDSVAVKIPIYDIVKVLVHYNRSLPVIFYYVTPSAGAKIRQILKMNDPTNFYFDPNSVDESHRRITLLPEKFTEEDKIEISNFYLNRDVLDELTHVEANQLLVRSAPKDIQKTVRLPPNPVQTIMVYPPPPVKGGISINTEDYSCLAEDTYLNDVIIDFYLKYLYHEKLSEEDRQKTHIFSSFFYKRLTDKATPVPRMLQNSKSSETIVTPAEIRHDRVKKWTKNIDIFSKDYIVIPLNENQHWFLAIICFPGLMGPVRFSDNTPIDLNSDKKPEEVNNENSKPENESDSSQTRRIGSTTITPIGKDTFTLADEDGDMEDRDEASGADEDVDEIFSSDEDTDEPYSETEPEPGEICQEAPAPKKKPEREPIKQPCILIFDSLKSSSRARIIATLREYLHVEYKMKHNGEERDFSKNVVKGACPKVPQQTNYTDCGLYVLQYVETFFESKISDFLIPIRTLSRWFESDIVSNKRYQIQKLLLKLMEEQKINVDALQLPELNLSPHRYHQYDSEDLEDYDAYYEDEDDEDGSGYDHLVGYDEEEEIEEHEGLTRRRFVEDGIEEYEEENEEGESRYAVYDTGDESTSNDDLSDDDDAYKGLDVDDMELVRMPVRQRRTLISVTRGGDGPDDEEILQEEEEELEEEDAIEVEDEIKLNNLSKDTVTISRMTPGSSAVKSQPTEAKSSSDLEQLMNARPWKKLSEVSIQRASEDDCPTKKFKSN